MKKNDNPQRTQISTIALAWLVSLAVAGCGGGGTAGSSSAPAETTLSPEAALGEKIFADPSLSASGRQSCASCHDPSRGHSPDNALAVQPGGPNGDLQGTRKAPGIRYLAKNLPFFLAADGTPSGGFFWDGRAGTFAEQATEPFLNPFEMATADKASVVAKLAAAPYADEFRKVFGADVFADVEGAYLRMSLAVQQYEREDVEFNAYSSKYDAFLRGQAALSDQELRGLALFNAPGKGNCAACHPSARGTDGAPPLFTDFSYDNLGVPRNPEILRNADSTYFDLGLCQRADLAPRGDLCGAFKVLRFATSPCARRSSTTAASRRSKTRSRSTSSATRTRRSSTRSRATARWRSSTTCHPNTASMSTPERRPTTAGPARRRRSRTPRSTTSSPFSKR